LIGPTALSSRGPFVARARAAMRLAASCFAVWALPPAGVPNSHVQVRPPAAKTIAALAY
jgi:hypothetical protein